MYEKISGFSDEIDKDIEKQFSVLNGLGIRYFEPRGINGNNISDLNDIELQALKASMLKYNISASSIGSPIGKIQITEDFSMHYEKFKRTVYIAKKLKAKYIRIFSFYIPACDYEKYRDEVISRLKKMTEFAEKNNVILLHENEKGIYGDTPERCEDIIKSVNSKNLRCVFDMANFVQCGVETYPYAFNKLFDYIEYVHIKDAVAEGGKVVPAGQGDGHIKEIIKELKKSGYNGFYSIEPHLGSFEGLQNLELSNDMLNLPKGGEGTFTLAFKEFLNILEGEF